MNTRFKVFASYNILQYLCDFIHDLIFTTVSKCQKSPKLTNIVIRALYMGEIVEVSICFRMVLTQILSRVYNDPLTGDTFEISIFDGHYNFDTHG